MNEKNVFMVTLITALFISILVFLHLPLEVYSRNPLEFISSIHALIPSLLLGVAILTIALLIPTLIPQQQWRKTYPRVLQALFIALWVSGVFLVLDLGEFDGGSFNISRHSNSLNWHSVIFAAVFAASLYLAHAYDKAVQFLVNIVGFGLVLISAFNFYQAGNTDNREWLPVNIEEISRFSTSKNLLIVMMDSFQSDAFPKLMDDDPELADKLQGFTYYPDTLGVAPSTYLTMPAFHSGKQYDNAMPVQEFYDVGVRNGSFLIDLASNGYQVDLVNPISGTCPKGASQCSKQENLLLSLEEIRRTESRRLLDLGILRAVPGNLKSRVFDGSSGPVSRFGNDQALSGLELRIFQSNSVLEVLADNLWTNDSAPTARLIHMFNTHPPYMFDRSCRFIGVKNRMNRDNMNEQLACSLNWFNYLLDSMKKHQVYDNTMIILVADTGVGNIWADDDLSSSFAQEHGLEPGELGRLIGGANPILAIKFPNSIDPLVTSNTPAQLTDIPQTVCTSLGDCAFTGGINLREPFDDDRERTYQYYKWSNNYWGLDFIPGMLEYQVDGPLWLESSWVRNLSDMTPVEIDHLTFSSEDPSQVYGMGWGQIETNAQGTSKRWAVSRRAELFIHLPKHEQLNLRFTVMNAQGLEDQTMSLFINGEKVGEREVIPKVHRITFQVPGDTITSEITQVAMEFSRLTDPVPDGGRRISVSFFDLEIFAEQAETE